MITKQVQGDWNGKVRIELSAILHKETPDIREFLSQLPDWTTSAGMTVLQKTFLF